MWRLSDRDEIPTSAQFETLGPAVWPAAHPPEAAAPFQLCCGFSAAREASIGSAGTDLGMLLVFYISR